MKIRRWYILEWLVRSRKKMLNFAAKKKEVKETKQKAMKVTKKNEPVSVRFPVFPFFRDTA